jgi:hypothetical protein
VQARFIVLSSAQSWLLGLSVYAALSMACAPARHEGESPTASTSSAAAERSLSVTFTDISVGHGPRSGNEPSTVIDEVNGALLVVADDRSNGAKPGLFRCRLDGTDCSYADVSAGEGSRSGASPVALLDSKNDKLLVVTTNHARDGKPGLFRCERDGSGCSYHDISAGQGHGSGLSPSAVIDATNGKLLVVTTNAENGKRLALFRCDLDGNGCTYSDIAAGQGVDSGWTPSAVIDETNGKLVVAARDAGQTTVGDGTLTIKDTPALVVCALDGADCVYRDISARQGLGCGIAPSAVIDVKRRKLLVATQNQDVNLPGDRFGILGLFRCDLDGTGCIFVDGSAGQGVLSAEFPSAVIDRERDELVVATWDVQDAHFPVHFGDPALYRCPLDGTGCTFARLTSSGPREFGYSPDLALGANGQLLLVAHTGDERLGLLSIDRD